MAEVFNSLRDLHPVAMPAFVGLYYDLQHAYEDGKIGQLFLPFESYRTPMRQAELLGSGQGVTRAGAWQSAHQYGLAVDFVPFLMGRGRTGWNWDHSNQWSTMRDMAIKRGLLVPHDWDRAHVVHPLWKKIAKILAEEPKPTPLPPGTVVK